MKLAALFNDRYLPFAKRTLKPRTVLEYERIARKLILPALGERLVTSLSIDDAERMHNGIYAPVQANRALAVLSAIMSYAVTRRLVATNQCRGLTRNREKGREFFYTPEQTRAIIDAARADGGIEAKYLSLCLLTGCRPGELLESGPSWRSGSVLRTPDGKTGARSIFLSPSACALLATCSGERYFPAGMDLRRAWDRLYKLAGVPRARLYDLRHTFASAALAAGTGLDVIGLMLGHKKRETTLRYAHLAPDVGVNAAAAAAERMLK